MTNFIRVTKDCKQARDETKLLYEFTIESNSDLRNGEGTSDHRLLITIIKDWVIEQRLKDNEGGWIKIYYKNENSKFKQA